MNYLEELKKELIKININKNILLEIDSFENSDHDVLLQESGSLDDDVSLFIQQSTNYVQKKIEKDGQFVLDENEKLISAQNIKDDVLKLGITKEKQIIIILGLPGAGKSSALNTIEKDYTSKFYLIDADDFKYGLNNNENKKITPSLTKQELSGIDVEYIHKASSELAKFILELLLTNDYNIALPKVGDDFVSMKNLVNDIHKKGYTIHLHFVYTTVETALKRNVERFKRAVLENKNIRLVPPTEIIEMGYKPLLTFIKFLNDEKISDCTLWDGEHYSSPRVVYKTKD